MSFAVRFAITWLAVWCQVFLVATMPAGAPVFAADPLGNIPICRAETDSGQHAPSRPAHEGHDCALCVICQTHTSLVALPSSAPALPVQQAMAIRAREAPRARAPPSLLVLAAQPRGPPSLA